MTRTKEPRRTAAASSNGNGRASTGSLAAFGNARVVSLEQGTPVPVNRIALAASHETNGASHERSAELNEKIKELLRLAQEQGYLTYNDIHDVLDRKSVV